MSLQIGDLPQRIDRCRAVEWSAAGQQLVENYPKAVGVRCRRRSCTTRLFGRHIGGSARERIGIGKVRFVVCRFRETKVGQVRLILAVDNNVSRLDVPVPNALPMRVMSGPRCLRDQFRDADLNLVQRRLRCLRRSQAEFTLGDATREALPVD